MIVKKTPVVIFHISVLQQILEMSFLVSGFVYRYVWFCKRIFPRLQFPVLLHSIRILIRDLKFAKLVYLKILTLEINTRVFLFVFFATPLMFPFGKVNGIIIMGLSFFGQTDFSIVELC